MLRELHKHPRKGLLGGEVFFHWRSFEDLERFARDPGDPHVPAWRRFNRSVRNDGSVGIRHGTCIVERE